MVRWADEGKDVILVVCTNGDKGTNDPNIKPEDLVITRDAEQRAAAELLMVRKVIFLDHPDQTLADTPEFREEITRLIRRHQPEVVVTTKPQRRYTVHPDHRNTGQVVLNAISLYARNLYAFPIYTSKKDLNFTTSKRYYSGVRRRQTSGPILPIPTKQKWLPGTATRASLETRPQSGRNACGSVTGPKLKTKNTS
jgi:LmbE family N-acetylglucosaminyl deacetylase